MDPIDDKLDDTVADIALHSGAMCDAALAGDFEEARLQAQIIVSKAGAAGLSDLALAAADALDRLGPQGGEPKQKYGLGIIAVAAELTKIGFRSKWRGS
jgi:hypothetical protein